MDTMDSNVCRDPEFYHDSGDTVFLVESTLFKVRRPTQDALMYLFILKSITK